MKLLFYNYCSFHHHIGNHESENMNQMYGFEGEVKSKYTFINNSLLITVVY